MYVIVLGTLLMRPLSFDFERGKTASLGTAQRNQRSSLDFLSGPATEVVVLEQLLLRRAVGSEVA